MLLVSLAHRLRNRRKELGLTQKELAEKAGVSQRFMWELEQGTANISVERLSEITAALQIPLSEVFRGIGLNGQVILSLVGLRGAGKSSVGRILASNLGVRFLELDQLIVEEAGMSLEKLFASGGIELYREAESLTLQRLFRYGKPMILATGGSLVTDVQNWTRLRDYSRTVWLQASAESHLQRVYKQGDWRPMRGFENAIEEVNRMLQERYPLYSQADCIIDTDQLSIEKSVAQLEVFYRQNI
jgi:XRE family aerobic/anaerobic benzoate catabolism transcriptional regulator